MARDDNHVPSCPAHPHGVADGCFACNILSNDILSCPAHPVGPVDECSACGTIMEIWTDFAADCSRQAAKDVAGRA